MNRECTAQPKQPAEREWNKLGAAWPFIFLLTICSQPSAERGWRMVVSPATDERLGKMLGVDARKVAKWKKRVASLGLGRFDDCEGGYIAHVRSHAVAAQIAAWVYSASTAFAESEVREATGGNFGVIEPSRN